MSTPGAIDASPDAAALESAFEWFVLMREGEPDAQRREAFAQWHAEPRHARAWHEVEQLWGRLDVAAPALGAAPAPAADAAGAARAAPAIRAHAFRGARPQARRRRWQRAAWAAAVVLAIAGIQLLAPAVPLWTADYRTDIAQRRSVTLDDGSRVELAGDSALSVDYDTGQRRLRLLRGEAYFIVARDTQRPFVVEAAGGSTRALGTQFDVRVDDAGARVVVTEHAVEVVSSSLRRVVGENQQLRYDADGIGVPEAVDSELALAWRQDRLMFREAPLREVVAALNRYRGGHVFIRDRALAQRPVTVALDLTDPEAALHGLSDALALRSSRLGSLVLLKASPSPADTAS